MEFHAWQSDSSTLTGWMIGSPEQTCDCDTTSRLAETDLQWSPIANWRPGAINRLLTSFSPVESPSRWWISRLSLQTSNYSKYSWVGTDPIYWSKISPHWVSNHYQIIWHEFKASRFIPRDRGAGMQSTAAPRKYYNF